MKDDETEVTNVSQNNHLLLELCVELWSILEVLGHKNRQLEHG